jgi:hypothetical protein
MPPDAILPEHLRRRRSNSVTSGWYASDEEDEAEGRSLRKISSKMSSVLGKLNLR